MTDGLIEEMKNNPRILKYIDLPLQHISDRVLRRMNRHGRSAEIREVLEKIRREIPDVVIRTTFIVGFPGETEEDFTELCEFVKEQRFARAGVFTYSREEGTPAYDFEDQIDEQVKQDRMDILMQTQMRISEELNNEKIGKTVNVLCEDYDPVSEYHFGRSEADAPDIDGKVYFKVKKRRDFSLGDFVKVKITDVIDYDLFGTAE
jgi:ribosomal protein S12 methylthiotransferase